MDADPFRLVLHELAEKLKPLAQGIDEEAQFSRAAFATLTKADLPGLCIPLEHGGAGGSISDAVRAIEEIARVSGSASCILAGGMVGAALLAVAESEALKGRYLPSVADGSRLMGWLPMMSAQGAPLTATRNGDTWILNGTQHWVTNIDSGLDVLLVVAARDPSSDSAVLLLIDSLDELSVGPLETELGLRGCPIRSLVFDDVRLPSDHELCSTDKVHELLEWNMTLSQVAIAALACGIAQGAIEEARAYVQQRQQFGRAIADFQSTRFMLAEMVVKTEAGRRLTYHAAQTLMPGRNASFASAVAKLWSTDAAAQVTMDAVQLFGGYGFVKDFSVERMMRDAKLAQLLVGSRRDERLEIAAHLLNP